MNFDLNLIIGTVNGSGSQLSNQILAYSLFKSGLSISPKNLFPSNISGLPTWFTIHMRDSGSTSPKSPYDIVVAMNKSTAHQDLQNLSTSGLFLCNSDLINLETLPMGNQQTAIDIPFKTLAREVSSSIKLIKLLTNMIYVGALAELIGLHEKILTSALKKHLKSKPQFIEINQNCIERGRSFIKERKVKVPSHFQLPPPNNNNQKKILISGNAAGAAGLVNGGCHFISWYPITPSSSLAESFERYANKYRKDHKGKNTFAIIQAEDELSAISMVLGAGWSGARSATLTSSPGLSLMSEAAGLSYFAEIPAVIWGVQRAGPSTGLPTRTMQGDLHLAYNMSHGDGQHIVLLPSTPQDCYDFGQIALDLAEQLQTLVIVLSDLDLGMNLWISDPLRPLQQKIQRGKVLRAENIQKDHTFARYKDVDKDAIPYRTLPGTLQDNVAHLTRGTGHNERAEYSEDPEEYTKLLNRLKRKFIEAKKLIPRPLIIKKEGAKRGVISFGSSWEAIKEVQESYPVNIMQLKALPLTKECEDFISKQEEVYVVEQNRDGQLLDIIIKNFPQHHNKLKSIRNYNGWPLEAQTIIKQGEFHGP